MASDFEIEIGMTYLEAREYLKSIGKWENVEDQDGFTIVAYAVELRSRNY